MKTRVEAGAFELLGISGVSLAGGHDAAGIRMAHPHVSLGLFDDKYLILIADAPDTYAPDLSYVKYSWRVPTTAAGIRKVAGWPCKTVNAPAVFDLAPDEAVRVTLEWRFDGHTATGRYTADGPVRVALFVNGCFIPGEVTSASKENCRLTIGDSVLTVRLRGDVAEPHCIDTRVHAEQVFAGLAQSKGKAIAMYPVALGPGAPLHFAMRLDSKTSSEQTADLSLEETEIDRRLAEGAEGYRDSRMRSSGMCAGAAEAVAGLSGYSRAYDPQRACLQTTVNRTWGPENRPGLIFGWDNFFDSYIAAWENPGLGAASLEHIVRVYGENGITNGPTQRNLIIPVVYCRTLDVIGDEELARRTWPTMMEFMRFWFSDRGDGHPRRDGNDDGLIESGADHDPTTCAPGIVIQEAMDETGYDDIPTYSAGFTEGRLGMLADGVSFDWDRHTLTITEVGQNSLYCASCRAMARWADRLAMTSDAEWLRAEEERVAARVRKLLYSEADGMFRDRYWSGGFAPAKTMTLFFPLLAGLADEPIKERLKEMLLDPEQFWGDNVIPTVSRDDPAYCDGLDGRGNYWRGNCWPPTTYMVYLAIKEAGWDDVAAEYAKRACAQFLEYWNAHGHAYENFPPEGKVDHRFLYVQPWGGREIRYVWSAMMLFCGLEEVFGPEMIRSGIRFGNPFLPEETSWTGLVFAGTRVGAVAGPGCTHVMYGDQWEFLAEPGVVVREFRRDADGTHFSTRAGAPVSIRYRAADLPDNVSVLVDEAATEVRRDGRAVAFSLPAGAHKVVIR